MLKYWYVDNMLKLSVMENPNFLKQKYNLHNAPEVEAAARRTQIRGGEKVPQKPADRIQNYLDRFKEITDRENPDKCERGIDALKRVLYSEFIIKSEEIPESYFANQQRLAREQGHGDMEITKEAREQLTEVIITDQKSSLDNWIDYLSSKDATYPNWLKYYAFRSMLNMSNYDKARHEFGKRDKGTAAPFPDLNREALAYVLDTIDKKSKKEKINLEGQSEQEQQEFQKLLQGENFAKLYAWAIEKVTPASLEALTNVKGEWIKYKQNSDHMPLVESLQGHGTGWCTAGESTADAQLKGGDFYVFYSYDEKGNPIIPRAAIRMSGNQIGEVRGVAAEQNLDPYIGDIVKQKLTEFPDGQAYGKKSGDMKLLTEIEKKTQAKQQLTKDELVFLYEMDNSIEGFGYQRDPRIAEVRQTRNIEEDAAIVFECSSDQIAKNTAAVNENTKAYIGKWNMDVFQTLKNHPNITHLYESFPDKKIFLQTLETDPEINSSEKAEKAIKDKNIFLSDYGKDMLFKTEFSQTKEKYDLVRFTVAQLGFSKGATTDEIYQKAEELGLELCPAEVGPQLRLQYPGKEYMVVAMKQITGRHGDPGVFDLSSGGGLELGGSNARPGGWWGDEDQFFFRFRKLET